MLFMKASQTHVEQLTCGGPCRTSQAQKPFQLCLCRLPAMCAPASRPQETAPRMLLTRRRTRSQVCCALELACCFLLCTRARAHTEASVACSLQRPLLEHESLKLLTTLLPLSSTCLLLPTHQFPLPPRQVPPRLLQRTLPRVLPTAQTIWSAALTLRGTPPSAAWTRQQMSQRREWRPPRSTHQRASALKLVKHAAAARVWSLA